MPRFSARWPEIALEQCSALPLAAQRQVDARIEQLLERPEGPREAYDSGSDQWTTTYGGASLILYAVVREHQRVLILRLV